MFYSKTICAKLNKTLAGNMFKASSVQFYLFVHRLGVSLCSGMFIPLCVWD